ncbi:glucose-1-phosphate adenylyltransferase [Paenibacillus sp. IHBB 10380]|uniref:glucose-1-phosphate adenylyltransferase n=1 Tax=Paenibacillus sp. IHBB 10380 TaxID=1566358 RepID=UPI0005CFBD05|nr:glucose-1-phosphate adenylyltransferase [Paenibacillus sp. IHBB 10380]AJS58374.1 glucose-1-phosphate adenylyltransferase [Paenibacillus sp. IHBB 10380]
MNKKNCIAMLLAGGEGRRLAPLTSVMAKPAVPFGGHYRIIDFPLSNCVNSGIETIGVLTQYEAESLHEHIGKGEPWGLHNHSDSNQGVSLLPSTLTGSDYLGTADAIYKNIDYIDQQNPEQVLILSGDHIYHMDYSEMLEYHCNKNATATLSVMEVPWEEASRFGLLNVDSESQISDFIEKPAVPESNLASMGIYIFKWAYLKEVLLKDAANAHSSHDFGKDIIPYMLTGSDPLFAYRFNGYWKDVGTVNSLWEAHMDLLDETGGFDLEKKEWPMYSRSWITRFNATKLKNGAVLNCLISDSCSHDGTAEKSIVFCGAEIGKNSSIKDSVIMPNVKIGRNVVIERAIIGEGAVIKDGTIIKGSSSEVIVIAPHETVFPKPMIRTQPSRLLQEVYEKSTRLRAEGLSS